MAITPLQPAQILPLSAPLAIPPVDAVGKPHQDALDNALRRDALLSTGLDNLVSLDPASVNINIATRSDAVAEVSTLPSALNVNPQEDATNATKAFLSDAGLLIDQLLHLALRENLPVSVQGQKPILASPPVHGDLQQTATALKNTLGQSGLFYESHIGEWVNNERSLASLMQEPQAQFSTVQMASVTSNEPVPSHSATILDNFNSSMAQVVSQQLNVLEQNRIVWQGEIWPGQQMAWEVSEDTSGERRAGQEDEAEPQAVWTSNLRFDLPHLGVVAAKVNWSGGHVQVQVHAANQPAASSLQAQGAQLANALGSAGCTLDALQVRVDAGGCQSS